MYNAPSKEQKPESTNRTEKHPDASLIKLFGQLRNVLTDPSTSQRAMEGIAGLAIGTLPKLGQYLGEVANSADMRNNILKTTSHLTGYQGPSLHDQLDVEQRIKQLEDKLKNRDIQTTFPDFSKQEEMPTQSELTIPMEKPMPPVPMGMSEPTPTMPPTGRQGY